jgi:hypothetical protein
MKKWACVAGLTALLVVAVSVLGADLDIKMIMKKAHSPTGLLYNIGKDLKDDEPDWDNIQQETKELLDLVSMLEKNKPPMGDQNSWKSLTASYLDMAKSLDAAAKKKNLSGAKSVQAKMSNENTCKGCHKVHRKD